MKWFSIVMTLFVILGTLSISAFAEETTTEAATPAPDTATPAPAAGGPVKKIVRIKNLKFKVIRRVRRIKKKAV